MFSNTTALDIAIGLVLVYFIYSLLVSIVGEMIVSWTGMRARTLRQGISNLLTDHQTSSDKVDLPKWLGDVFMKEPVEFKYTTAGRFYQEPAIRNLAKRGENLIYTFRNTKPGYISKETYARTLLNMFNRKGRGVTERERVFMAVDTNALHLEPKTDKRFKEMLVAANGDYVLFATNLEDDFEQMMDRVNGWYKRKLGFVLFWLGFFICAVLNVNTFEIVKILSRNPKVRADVVKLAGNAVSEKNAMPWADVSPDSSAYVTLLNEGYGKAIRDAKEVEFLLGKGWEVLGKKEIIPITDSLEIAKVCQLVLQSNKLRAYIKSVKDLIETDELTPKELKKKIGSYYELTRQYRIQVLDSLDYMLGKKLSSAPLRLDVLAKATGKMEDSSATFLLRIKDNVENLRKEIEVTGDSVYFQKIRTQQGKKAASKNGKLLVYIPSPKKTRDKSISVRISGFKSAQLTAIVEPAFGVKFGHIFCTVFAFWKSTFWGIVLSALALSLGANFWFDLLKKLVSLRSAGVKPEEKKDEAKPLDVVARAQKDGTYVEINDPIEKALSENRKTWESTSGVVAVNRAEIEVKGKKVEGIEIVKDSSYFDKSIPNIISVQIQNIPTIVNIDFRNGSAASLNPGANDEGQDKNYVENCIIHNSTKSWGTATGWVKDKDGNRALLSCGHALRSDTSGYIKENMDKVSVWKNGKSIPLGTVTNLFLTNYLDIGLVSIDSGTDTDICKEIPKVQSVIRKKSPVKIITLRKGGQPKDGQIESINWNNRFDASNQNFIMYNLILIHFSDQGDVTAPGDSGSVVMDTELKTAIAIHIGQVTLTGQKYSLAVGLHEIFKILNLKTF